MSDEKLSDDKVETWSIKFNKPEPFAGMNLIKAEWLAEHGNGTVSWSEFNRFLKKLSVRVVNLMAKQDYANVKVFAEYVESVEKRLLESSRKIYALERAQTKSLADFYKGVWQPAGRYERGDVCTWQGGMWVAIRSTETKPGDGDSGWQLAVKAGRDGKDLRS